VATDRSRRIEFGDFQTPPGLAADVCAAVSKTNFRPRSILEPTCGRGVFLLAALSEFPCASRVLGFDRNPDYVKIARAEVTSSPHGASAEVKQADFFSTDWAEVIDNLPQPILVIGNPPWVTNAALGGLGSLNLPPKSNTDNLRGIEALTGHSNFDISEWMLRESVQWLASREGTLAVLCKTAVARKVLTFAWSRQIPVERASIYRIDAKAHFGASVDACLLLVRTRPGCGVKECAEYESLLASQPQRTFGVRDGQLVADVTLFERWRCLLATEHNGWRSGIKHDCSTVFELDVNEREFRNGLGERVEVERDVVFPLMKSSDLAAGRTPKKWLLLPQRFVTESPDRLQSAAPKAWQYLGRHRRLLDERGSTIYRKRPPFSVFGVGPYSFSPWKVAISGLYKRLEFRCVGPLREQPVVFDDTCYLFPCDSQEQAGVLHKLVTSPAALEFWSALVFWDAKRPITAKLLNSLDLAELARAIGVWDATTRRIAERQMVEYSEHAHQALLFQESAAPRG
jgi:hypothetical protein